MIWPIWKIAPHWLRITPTSWPAARVSGWPTWMQPLTGLTPTTGDEPHRRRAGDGDPGAGPHPLGRQGCFRPDQAGDVGAGRSTASRCSGRMGRQRDSENNGLIHNHLRLLRINPRLAEHNPKLSVLNTAGTAAGRHS